MLEAPGRALQLDEAERAHLADLARAAGLGTRTHRKAPAKQVRPSVQRILELMTDVPAFVNNARLDILAANPLAQALYAPLYTEPTSSASCAPAATPSG